MSANTGKLILYVFLSAAGPALAALMKAEPTWTWLSAASSMVFALLAAIHVDPPATVKEMKALRARVVKNMAGGALTIAVFFVGVGAAASVSGCSWLSSPQGAATVTAGVDLAVCVLNHINEPIQQIVTDCGAATAQDVIRILDAHRAAEVRERAKDGGQ
jgi:hypothetical protein